MLLFQKDELLLVVLLLCVSEVILSPGVRGDFVPNHVLLIPTVYGAFS